MTSTSARRELEEETGYRAAQWENLGEFYSSPGMVAESFTLLKATGLTQVSDGGGTAHEDIVVHRVPLAADRRDYRRAPRQGPRHRRQAGDAARRRAARGCRAMKVLILGAGAMGCLYGAAFHRAGCDVVFVDVNRPHIDAINARGLELETRAGTELLPIPARLPAEIAEPVDLVVVFTKTFHTDGALAGIAAAIGPQTWLLSLQNGLGNDKRLAAHASRRPHPRRLELAALRPRRPGQGAQPWRRRLEALPGIRRRSRLRAARSATC